MNKLNGLDWLAITLAIIGALNWGLVGLFQYNLVATLLGTTSSLTRIVYSLVGISGVYLLYTITKIKA